MLTYRELRKHLMEMNETDLDRPVLVDDEPEGTMAYIEKVDTDDTLVLTKYTGPAWNVPEVWGTA